MRELGPTHTNAQLAEHLNQTGQLTASGRPFDEDNVRWLRWHYRIPSPSPFTADEIAVHELAQRLNVGDHVIWSGSDEANSPRAASASAASRSASTPTSRPPATNDSQTHPEPGTSTQQPLTEAQNEDNVDEISYRRGQRYLTSVADHATGAIVWCQPGRNSATLQGFFDELGDRRASIRAVSIDMSGEYQRAIRQAIPHAQICFDPFHVCRLASRATDQVRRDE